MCEVLKPSKIIRTLLFEITFNVIFNLIVHLRTYVYFHQREEGIKSYWHKLTYVRIHQSISKIFWSCYEMNKLKKYKYIRIMKYILVISQKLFLTLKYESVGIRMCESNWVFLEIRKYSRNEPNVRAR